MDKNEEKIRELRELDKERIAEEKEILKKYGCLEPGFKPKGFRDYPEIIALRPKYKAKYIAICEKYK